MHINQIPKFELQNINVNLIMIFKKIFKYFKSQLYTKHDYLYITNL